MVFTRNDFRTIRFNCHRWDAGLETQRFTNKNLSGNDSNNNNINENNNQADQNGLILGSSNLEYTQASNLLRIKGTPDVYSIMNGKRHYIAGPNSFEAYGYSWDDVKEVSREKLYLYPLANLLKTPNDNSVYHIFERPENKWLKIVIWIL